MITVTNQFGQLITNYISQLFIIDKPVTFDLYVEHLNQNTSINIENISNLKEKYEYYLLVYNEFRLKPLFNQRYGWRLNTKYTLKDRLTNNCCIEYWLAQTST